MSKAVCLGMERSVLEMNDFIICGTNKRVCLGMNKPALLVMNKPVPQEMNEYPFLFFIFKYK